MFCKNCGSTVQDGIRFCPKCGKATAGRARRNGAASGAGREFGYAGVGSGMENFGYTGTGNAAGMSGAGGARAKAADANKLFMIVAAVAVVVVAMTVFFAVRRNNADKNASIVGEWVSTSTVDMGGLLDAVLEANGISGMGAQMIRSALDAWYNINDNLALVFYERGDFGITFGGAGVTVLDMTYEQMPNGKLNMNIGFNGILKQIPIKGLSFNVKCKVKKDTMTMEVFGSELQFQRR